MTIEIPVDDLLQLAEAAETNGTSVVFMTHSTDHKRVCLVVTCQARRKRRRAGAALKLPTEAAQGAA